MIRDWPVRKTSARLLFSSGCEYPATIRADSPSERVHFATTSPVAPSTTAYDIRLKGTRPRNSS